MGDTTLRDRIRIKCICIKLEIAPIDDKMRENRLRWFEHVQHGPINAQIRKSNRVIINGQRRLEEGPSKLGWKQ